MHGARTPLLDSPPLVRYGQPEVVYPTAPAAAADLEVAVTGAFLVRLIAVYFTLDTDANVADRYVSVQYANQAGDVYAVDGPPVAVEADSVQPFSFTAFQPRSEWPVGGHVIVPLSPILLPPTHKWSIVMTDAEAGDALLGIRYVQERFYQGSPLALQEQ